MDLKLYAACPKKLDVFDTDWVAPGKENLSELEDYVYVIACKRCGEVHAYRRNEFFAVKVPDKKQPEAQPAYRRHLSFAATPS
jgi:hypothetical protein